MKQNFLYYLELTASSIGIYVFVFTKTINRYYFVEFPKFSLQLTTPFAELFHLFLLSTYHST